MPNKAGSRNGVSYSPIAHIRGGDLFPYRCRKCAAIAGNTRSRKPAPSTPHRGMGRGSSRGIANPRSYPGNEQGGEHISTFSEAYERSHPTHVATPATPAR